ncbi:hypothetical protein CROQUDRAFT_661311 [Cronartium quercuum f. sp. fusiforme G11]|uniref:Uncharacterized protein n=1 Tax=Cronartium quercuum f. sp. fusiforme G11 TaxID=708437 RepID=A0A9P6T8V4_9BASI|nr:hypothetical protein CROQUDRAFT_661311 [Cronartium quercuum f. sp. fusiforme G11]
MALAQTPTGELKRKRIRGEFGSVSKRPRHQAEEFDDIPSHREPTRTDLFSPEIRGRGQNCTFTSSPSVHSSHEHPNTSRHLGTRQKADLLIGSTTELRDELAQMVGDFYAHEHWRDMLIRPFDGCEQELENTRIREECFHKTIEMEKYKTNVKAIVTNARSK